METAEDDINEKLRVEAQSEQPTVPGISETMRNKIQKLMSIDAHMASDVLQRLETARRRMRGRLEHRVDVRLHAFNLTTRRPSPAISWNQQ